MKVFALLFVFGLVAANSEFRWETGKDYVYKYSGRLLTGFPELAEHYSGLAINCTVHVQVVESDRLVLTIRDAKYVKVNDKLEPTYSIDGMDGYHWRELRLPELTSVPQEYSSILAMPVSFKLVRGEIRDVKISRKEPLWSVNFKKALVLQFQTKMDTSSLNEDENRINDSDEGLTYWKVKEDTIKGVCTVIYQVNELPRYFIKDRPEMIPFPKACTEEKYYGITKTRNLDNCERRSKFSYFKPGSAGLSPTGNFKDAWSTNSETRYIACGSRGRLVIQTIISSSELSQDILMVKAERMLTGTLQVLSLKEVRESSHSVPLPSDMVSLKTLMYEYTYESYRKSISDDLKQMSENGLVKGRIPEELLSKSEVISETLPRSYLSGMTPEEMEHEMNPERIGSQITALIKEIVTDTNEGEQLSKKHLGMKVLSVARGMGLLKKESLTRLYSELKSEFQSSHEDLMAMKSIWMDTLMMGGTPDCVRVVKEMVLSGELTTSQLVNVFIWLPQYVIAPTTEVMTILLDLISNERIRETKLVYSTAIMSYSLLIQKACISSFRRAEYPVHVFGEMCTPTSEIVIEKWIPYLAHELKSTESYERRNDILVAIGLLSHKNIIPHLLPIVEGTAESVSPMNRVFAIMALYYVGLDYPTPVIPMLYTIISNPAESTDIRITAFNILLRMNPPLPVLHKIVSLTWRTKNLELLKTINTAFYTLSLESSHPQWEHRMMTLPKKAYLVYPLIKKVHGFFPSSASIYTMDIMKDLKLQYSQTMSYISSNTTIVPKSVYFELKYLMDSFEMFPISTGIRLSNAESLIHEISKYLGPLVESRSVPSSPEISSEWKKVIDQLQLKGRKGGLLDGAFMFRLFESTPFFVNFDKMTIEEFKSKILPYLVNPDVFRTKMCGKHSLNFQRTMDLTPTQLTIPSDMGFPINLESHYPVVISLRGHVDVECGGGRSIPSISVKGKALVSSLYTGWVGTICPFTKEYVVTGVEEHSAVYLPTELSIRADVPAHKLLVSLKPYSSSETVELMHLITRPFTASKKISDIVPLVKSTNFKVIRSDDKEKRLEYTLGEFLGLNLACKIKTETPHADFKTFADILKLWNYYITNQMRFPMIFPSLTKSSGLSFRSNEYTIEFVPSSASTKEIEMEFKVGYGTKSLSEAVHYHSVQVNDAMEGGGDDDDDVVAVVPFKTVQFNADTDNVHPRRQLKIKQSLQDVEQGRAVTLIYTTTLKGSRVRSWTYQLTAFQGSAPTNPTHGIVKHKWSVMLESEGEVLSQYTPFKHVCLKGELSAPLMPVWNMNSIRNSMSQFSYKNIIGMGSSSCEESTILITGRAAVSVEQKEFSTHSEEAKRCQQMIEKNINGAQLSPVCDKTRLQAKTVDEVEFRISYKNMPKTFHYLESRLTDTLKTFLWPNLRTDSHIRDVKETNEVLCRLQFSRLTPSLDLVIQRNEEKLVFRQVRLFYPLSLLFPLKAGVNNVRVAVNALTGYSTSPKCKILSNEMITYRNRSLPFRIDYCFHLLSGDCSSQHRSGILIRNMKPGNRRQLKVFLGQSVIMLTPADRNGDHPYTSNLSVTIESEELYVPVNTWKPLVYDGREYGTIFRSSDNVIHLKAPKYYTEFLFDGDQAVIFGSSYLKNRLCGLCGNFYQEHLAGPKQCMYSSPEIEVASYHVPSDDCEMSGELKQQLQNQLNECVQYEEYPTKLAKSVKLLAGKSCTVLKHLVLERANKICLSKVPVTECSPLCKISPREVVHKKVPFTCLPEGRTAQIYVKKAYDGQALPELKSMPTYFESNVDQPKRCFPINPRN